jgi:hypothetical protein
VPCEKRPLPRKALRRPHFEPGELYQISEGRVALILGLDNKGLVVRALISGHVGLWDVWSFADELDEPPRRWVE